ncbi:hypothetical protein L873DRAFT_891232 [Choiromyces venosus 120613-1]|uniref:Uncharacterized protein n=1 Tax=Choiromyces venosus 120613-1 TaxID=1336337 RepID=A0A3N4JN20_9PEZI|nr:hypothetical protein L873DRAFT_891232 [Choiromyces venosus 120613-1]
MLTTLSGKQDFQAAMQALEDHKIEEEKRVNEKEDIIQVQGTTKVVKKESKVESLKDKRRKIRERGEQLDAQLAEEGDRMTSILERVTDALISSTGNSINTLLETIAKSNSGYSGYALLILSEILDSSSSSQLQHESKSTDILQEKFNLLEDQVQSVEASLKQVQDNMNKILDILGSRTGN